MPDVVFLCLGALIVSQLGCFMAGPVPVAKQLKILWLWRERGEGRGGGRGVQPLGKWQDLFVIPYKAQ